MDALDQDFRFIGGSTGPAEMDESGGTATGFGVSRRVFVGATPGGPGTEEDAGLGELAALTVTNEADTAYDVSCKCYLHPFSNPI